MAHSEKHLPRKTLPGSLQSEVHNRQNKGASSYIMSHIRVSARNGNTNTAFPQPLTVSLVLLDGFPQKTLPLSHDSTSD